MIYFGANNVWTSKPTIIGLDKFTNYKYKPDADNKGELHSINNINGTTEYTYDQLSSLIAFHSDVLGIITDFEITNVIYDIQHAEGGSVAVPDAINYYPSYVDVIFNPEQEVLKTLTQIYWNSIAKVNLGVNGIRERYDKTFTHMMVYTTYQCSGYIPLVNYQSNHIQGRLKNVNGRWNFNYFRDLIIHTDIVRLNSISYIGEQIAPKIFNEITDTLDGTLISKEGYVDTNNTIGSNNVIKPYFDKSLFQDLYFIVRFAIDNKEGYELSLGEVGVTMDINQ